MARYIENSRNIIGSLLLFSTVTLLVFSSCRGDKSVSFDSERKRIDSLILESKKIHRDSSYDNAVSLIEQCKAIAIETFEPDILGGVLYEEALILKRQYKYVEAIKSLKQAEKLYIKANKEEELSNVYYNLADIYKTIGEYSQSLDYCGKGLAIYKQMKNMEGQKKCYRVMGSIYKYIKNYGKSIQYYELSLGISKESGDEEGVAIAYNNLGTTYELMEEYEKALECYSHSFDVYKRTNNSKGLSLYYNNTGSIYMLQKRYDEAIACFRLALKYRKLNNDYSREAVIISNIGDYFYATNNLDSSIIYYQKGLDVFLDQGLKEKVAKSYLDISKAYQKNQMPLEAYSALQKYIQVKDTLYNVQKSIEIAKLEANFDTLKEQMQTNSEKQKKNLLFIIYLLSVFVLSVFVAFFYKRFKRTMHEQELCNQILAEEKSRIEDDLSDKNRELVTYSLQIAQKNEIDKALADRIQNEIGQSNGETKRKLQDILNNINYETQRINIWDDFEVRFNQVNNDFYNNLLDRHPLLTHNEKRLCAFLKLNLNSKEITLITGQSPHSINVARTRLRKKLQLTNNDQSLFDYLRQF